MTLYTAAISLSVCVQGVGTRVARVGGRCAVVWLASEWHRVVCAVCVLHMVLKVAPSSCIRSQSLIALLRFCCFRMNTPSLPLPPPLSPPPHTHRSSLWLCSEQYTLQMFELHYNISCQIALNGVYS